MSSDVSIGAVNSDRRVEIIAADVAASALCPPHNPLRFSRAGFIAGCYLSCGVGGDHSSNNPVCQQNSLVSFQRFSASRLIDFYLTSIQVHY